MATSDRADGDRLVALYRSYLGEPDRRTDVYVGFALFFAGLGLGLLGLALFAVERVALTGTAFLVREIAFVSAALGLPLVLVAVVVLLPADRRALAVAAFGFVVVLAAVAFFVAVYPSNWNYGTPDYSLHGVTVYAVGLISVLAATGSSLVGYHVERAEGSAAATAEESGRESDAGAGADPEATEAQVQADIEEAMSGADISWGGVEKVDTEQLRITPDEELEGESLDQESATVHRSSGIDDQLSALQGLQGGEQRTDSGSGVDDQAAKLQELREKQRAEAAAEPDGLVDRVRSYLGR